MSTYPGAWRPEEPKEEVPNWDFLAYRKSSPEGPWNGIQDLFPEGKAQLPRSAGGFLKAAQEHGWGFGPISLVMRLNRSDAKPLYVSWLYSIPSSNWSFDGAGVRGHHIAKAGEALALVKTEQAPEPKAPDWSRYYVEPYEQYTPPRVGVGCQVCGPLAEEEEMALLPELLKAIEDHEIGHHAEVPCDGTSGSPSPGEEAHGGE